MSKIRVKNFGPIKDGLKEENGWLDIKKVTVFIGNQGSGKSTVAKLISSMFWREKELNWRSPDADLVRYSDAYKELPKFRAWDTAHWPWKLKEPNNEALFEYHGLLDYFSANTQIEYEGPVLFQKFTGYPANFEMTLNRNGQYQVPKIIYIPSERNFVSSATNFSELEGLSPSFFSFASEYRKAQNRFGIFKVKLPIGNNHFEYDDEKNKSYLIGDGFKLELKVSSSGFQSLTPLYIVSKYLSLQLSKPSIWDLASVDKTVDLEEETAFIYSLGELNEIDKQTKFLEVKSRYTNSCFVNIVEEPEQNLYPSSQRDLLNSLLEINNEIRSNKLVLTTHSPYIISYLTLAMKAFEISKLTSDATILDRLNEVVPSGSMLDINDVVIYQMLDDGSISQLDFSSGIPSDNHLLNQKLEDSNVLFDKLLDLEELCL